MTSEKKRPGPASLFRGKLRKPVTLTLTPEHHEKIDRNKRRIGCTRADLIALLIEKHADHIAARDELYGRLIDAVVALGGTLQYEPWNGPRGGAWVLRLGDRQLKLQSKRNAALDACYKVARGGAVSRVPDSDLVEIDPVGLAALINRLAGDEGAPVS